MGINPAIDESCPMVKASVACEGNPWITEAMKDKQKTHMFCLHDKWQALKTTNAELEYKTFLREYIKHCGRVKPIYGSYYRKTLQTEAEMADL